jgi:hypothetical protein
MSRDPAKLRVYHHAHEQRVPPLHQRRPRLAREAAILIDLSGELSYLPVTAVDDCRSRCKAVVGSLQNLARALEKG